MLPGRPGARETGGTPGAPLRQCSGSPSHLTDLTAQQYIMWRFIAQAITGVMLVIANFEMLMLF